MSTSLIETTGIAPIDTNPYRVVKHLKRKIKRDVQSAKLVNGSHVRSQRFNSLHRVAKRMVRKHLEGHRVINRATGYVYAVVWDDQLEKFALISV